MFVVINLILVVKLDLINGAARLELGVENPVDNAIHHIIVQMGKLSALLIKLAAALQAINALAVHPQINAARLLILGVVLAIITVELQSVNALLILLAEMAKHFAVHLRGNLVVVVQENALAASNHKNVV